MNLWSRVIVEWANCLGIVDSDIESIKDLQNGEFYEKLIYQLCKGNENYSDKITISQDERDPVTKFIQSEYPEFGSVDCAAGIPEELYVASLLLVRCSQQPMFHRPMCVALEHETQVRIKHFLEMVLPRGRNLTKESVGSAIMELADVATGEESTTPTIRPLREFFNSPAVRSAQSQRFMNDRNRELMCLRAQLETEQFEKADLMEDIKKQNEKMVNLQRKLDEKSRELRELRINRFEPSTPQSCRKAKRTSDNEERYRREADHLQTLNSQLESEIEKLRDEREDLARRLISSEKFNLAIREKYEQTEIAVDNIARQLEMRNSEIIDLRTSNDELREQIRESKRISIVEPNFYAEPLCDEAMSSVIDIQLQDARKEASRLKSELSEMRDKYESRLRDCERSSELEIMLREKTSELDSIGSKLRDVEELLSSSEARASNLEIEKSKLCDVLEKLGTCVQEKDELLNLAEKRNDRLKTELEMVNSRARESEISLSNEKLLTKELRSSLEIAKSDSEDLKNLLSSAEDKLSLVTNEKIDLKSIFDKTRSELEESLILLAHEKTNVERLETMNERYVRESEDFKERSISREEEIRLLNDDKELAEFNHAAAVKKLEETEIRLKNEGARVEELKATLLRANRDIDDSAKSLRTYEQLLNAERSKVNESEAALRRVKQDNDHTRIALRDTRMTLEAEKEASRELREIVSREKKISEERENALRSLEQILRESEKRQSSMNDEMKSRESRIARLEESLRMEVSRSRELERELTRAREDFNELRSKLTATEDSLREKEISGTRMEARLREADETIVKIQSDFDIARTKLSDVEEEKRRVISSNEKLEEYAKVADEKLINVEMKIFDRDRRIRDLDESLNERIEKCNKLQNELNEKNMRVNTLSERLRDEETRGKAMLEAAAVKEKKIADLENELEEMKNRMIEEDEKMMILRGENENLAEKLSDHVGSKIELEKSIERAKRELEAARDNLREESSVSEELRKIVEESSDANNKLNEMLSVMKNRLTEVLSERDGLVKQLNESVNETSIVKQLVEKMERKLEESDENVAGKSSVIEELKIQNEEMRTEYIKLEEKLVEEKNEFETVVNERDGLKEQLDAYVNEISIMKQRIEIMEQKLEESNENVAEKSSVIEELRIKIEEMHATHNELEEKLVQEKNEFETVVSERDGLKEQLNAYVNEISIMKQRIEIMEQKLEESGEDIAKKSSSIVELRIKIEEMHTTHNELEEKLVQEKKQFENVLSERDGLEKQLNESVKETSMMKQLVEKMERKLEESGEDIAKKSSSIEELRIKIEEMHTTHNELEEKLVQEKKQFENVVSERDGLEKQLNESVKETSIMKQRIETMEQKLEESNENVAEKSSIIKELRIKIDDMHTTHNELEEKLVQEKKQFENVVSVRDGLEKQLNESVKETSIMKQRIEITERKLEESNENVAEKSSIIEELKIQNEEMSTNYNELEEKLVQEKNEFETVVSERDGLKEQLNAYVNEISIMKQRIETMEQKLEESNENVAEKSSIIEELKIQNEEMSTNYNELEEKLVQEKNEFETVVSERDGLKEQLNAYVNEILIMKQRIEIMEQKLEESNNDIQKESSVNEKLEKELESLHTINGDLRDELADAREQYKTILAQKTSIEKDIAAHVKKTSIMERRMDYFQNEMDRSGWIIQKQIYDNKILTKKESELSESMKKLQEELSENREKYHDLETKNVQLEEELSSLTRSNADMIEEKSALKKELESTRKEQENLRSTSEKDCSLLRQRIGQLEEETKTRTEELNRSKNDLESVRSENSRLLEKIDVASSTIKSLENRLVNAENAREELKLEDKLKEEALVVVRSKLEQLGKEKIETELRLNEVITNLQEVRTSQDHVLQAQVKAIEEKTSRLTIVEKELSDAKIALMEKTRESENERSRIKSILEDFERLRERSNEESKLAEELRLSLERERRRINEESLVRQSLSNKITEIDKSSKALRIELNLLWNTMREACPELPAPNYEETIASELNTEDVVASFVDDAKTIREAVSMLGEANASLKERLDSEKKAAIIVSIEVEKRKNELDERLNVMENEIGKRDEYLFALIKRKKDLRGLLSTAIDERNVADDRFVRLTKKWSSLDAQARAFLANGSSECKELETLKIKRDELEKSLSAFDDRHSRGSRDSLKTLCRIFLWSETKLQEACEESSPTIDDEFSPEAALSEEIERDRAMKKAIASIDAEIDEFSIKLDNYESKYKSEMMKLSAINEEKLQTQLERTTREKKELKEKLDAARLRNAKMEKNMDELRNVNKKLKTEIEEATGDEERAELERLRAFNEKLEIEKADLLRKIQENGEIDSRLETVHSEYGQKLEKIKQKMKTAYNEQIAKLNQEQEKLLKEKMDSLRAQTEQQCRKYTEDIAKYKAHITDLSSRYWDVGEKLLAETQEKQAALQQLQRYKDQQHQQETMGDLNERTTQNRQKTASLDRREFTIDRATRDSTARGGYRAVEVIEEETTTFSTRRHSVKSIQAMGNAFKAEDEEGELFDSVYLADLKEGRCAPIGPDFDRISELRIRNSMCRPHLKSSYAVETNLQPVALNEDDIKNGVVGDDVFNDSLSQSLLPGQKPKRKDRTQTSYKRPGPPTPSKNGGRLSLQGNEAKSPGSRILKERNVERRTTATPRGLKNLFGASMSKRQDENTAGTPKGRRLSNIFRKQRTERN